MSQNYEDQIKTLKSESSMELSKLQQRHECEIKNLENCHVAEVQKLNMELQKLDGAGGVHSDFEKLKSSLEKSKAETKVYADKVQTLEEEVKKSSEVLFD